MDRISKKKSKFKNALAKIKMLYKNIVNSVKTTIISVLDRKYVIATTLVAMIFTVIFYLFIGKVIGNSSTGVEERFSVDKEVNENVVQNSVVIKEGISEKHIVTNVMSVTDEIENNKDNTKDYVENKISSSNKKTIEKIDEIKKAKEAKKAEEEAQAEAQAKKNKEEEKNSETTKISNQESTNSGTSNSGSSNSSSSGTSNTSSSSSGRPPGWSSINMVATAYDLSYESCGKYPGDPGYGITASGTRATKGRTIAVDSSVIPLGTQVYIDFNSAYNSLDGYYIAEDTGGAVKGNRIDVFVGDNAHSYALSFGTQSCVVYLK